jgi:hypothetical protein
LLASLAPHLEQRRLRGGLLALPLLHEGDHALLDGGDEALEADAHVGLVQVQLAAEERGGREGVLRARARGAGS